MTVRCRPFDGDTDARRMQHLANTFPERTVHVTDLPYRLASPALHTDPEADTALWEDGDRLLAWAVWQFGWVTLDYALDAARARDLGRDVLAWGEARFREVAQGRDRRLPYWVSSRHDDDARIALLEQAGFRRTDWTTVRQERPLDQPLPAPEVPEGFTIRPLRGEAEVESYVVAHRAAFGTANMTAEFRRRVLRAPEYRPELDLVVEAPDGRIAAFTILWLGRRADGGTEGQFEPVGTHPDFQRRGLARALLLAGGHGVREAGGTHAVVEADSFRTPARTLYESLLPRRGHSILHYAKDF